MRAVLPACVEHGTRLVTNMGVANPSGAAERTAKIARELGLKGLKIAALEGDDVHAPDRPRYASAGGARPSSARSGGRWSAPTPISAPTPCCRRSSEAPTS